MEMEKRRRNYGTQTYIDGNTVRKLEAAPDYRREQEEKQREEIRRRNRRVAQKNQEKAAHMDLGYVAFLSVSLLVMCVAAVMYIRLQSGITTHLKTISALESQVAELKADNDAAEKRIETAVDLATIKDVAMNQLGMGYAGPDQIIHYTVDKEDYMNQFEDIPNK